MTGELTFPNAVEEPPDFFDRTNAITEIREALHQRTRRTVVILGGRLIGKTSLLNVVAQWAETDGAFTVVRLAHAGTREDLMAEIVHGIQDRVGGDRDDELLDPGYAGPTTVARFVRIVQELARKSPRAQFLLCIDEFDSLLQACDEQPGRQILNLVLHLTEHTRLPIRFLMTLSRIPEQIRLSYGSPFLNQATIVELRPWSATTSRQFVEWLLDGGPQLDDAAHDVLFGAAGGHPYFTKAVLKALLAAQRRELDGWEPSPATVQDAVTTAARSREVDVALSNITDVHLPPDAVGVLDRAGASPAGLAERDVRAITPADGTMATLVEDGLLSAADNRYFLRLGMWRQWRSSRRAEPPRPAGAIAGLSQAVLRYVGNRPVRATLLSALVVLLVALALGTAFLVPKGDKTIEGCPPQAADLRVDVEYPSYLSEGDEQGMRVTVRNVGRETVENVSVIVEFPEPNPPAVPAYHGVVDQEDDNSIDQDQLQPGEQETITLTYTYGDPERWLPDFGSKIPVQVRISAAGGRCPAQGWELSVAPVPHLRDLQKAIFGLVAAVLFPLLTEWALRRRRGRHTPGDGGGRPGAPGGQGGPGGPGSGSPRR